MINKYGFILIIFALLLISVSFIYLIRPYFKESSQKEGNKLPLVSNDEAGEGERIYHNSYRSNADWYEDVFSAAGDAPIVRERVYGGIIPHHLLASGLIARFFKGLELKNNPKVVALLAPNHFNAGSSGAIGSMAYWRTPFGELDPATEIISRLERSGLIEIEEEPFQSEHSISTIIPFIKKTFPNAKIAPIILKNQVSPNESDKIAEAIAKYSPEEILVIASVDFSHFLSSQAAQFHDDMAVSVIEHFDFDDVYKLEVDSPPSIYTLLSFLKLKKAQQPIFLQNTNSAIISDSYQPENVSYLTEYFIKGEEQSAKRNITILGFGDMMLGRYVGELMEQNEASYPFLKLEANNFLRGVDFIWANLEGPITDLDIKPKKAISFRFNPKVVSVLKKFNFYLLGLANNHAFDQGAGGDKDTRNYLKQAGIDFFGSANSEEYDDVIFKSKDGRKLSFIGFNTVGHSLDLEKSLSVIKRAKDESDFVIMSIHWGSEYQKKFNSRQSDLAHKFIEAGADVIFGHHPHVIQPIEIYQNKPIFYSLGNFIFDQYFSKNTQRGLSVGMTIGDDKIRYYLFPLESQMSQPNLMSPDKEDAFLNELIGPNSEEVNNQIKNGMIEIENNL